jgi:ribonuclease P protein component
LNKQHFPRNHRLLTKAEYKNIFDNSFKVNQKYLLALFKPNHKSYARLGLIVSKRSANQAVARNQIKRVVRESFRLINEQFSGLDIIVIARQQCDILDKANLRRGIEKLWEKLHEYVGKHPHAFSS